MATINEEIAGHSQSTEERDPSEDAHQPDDTLNARRSKRQRVATKQYNEDEGSHKPKTAKTGTKEKMTWKEEELEKLLDCLKKYQRTDNVKSVKKHVKTKNIEQVEAKLESLHRKAVDRAIDETVGKPPLPCWESLAKDVTSTLSDDSYKEISKVFWTAVIGEQTKPNKTTRSNPHIPNYNEIYRFLAALLRDNHKSLPELAPIDSLVVLECLQNTIEFLQNMKTKQKTPAFLQKTYEELYHKVNSIDFEKVTKTKQCTTTQRADHSYDRDGMPSSSSETVVEETVGLGTLNPFNIPVDKLNLKRPQPCSEHGNLYCWIEACRTPQKVQQT